MRIDAGFSVFFEKKIHENWKQIQRRFEREALALQKISPEILLRRRDIIRYFIRAVLGDVLRDPQQIINPISFFKIICYRYHQYLGGYRGNYKHNKINPLSVF